MSESKELLEATIKGLEEKLESVKSDLGMKVRELSDINKPEMTDVMYDELSDLVSDAVNDVYLSDDDIEYSLDVDYDRRINICDVSLNSTDVFINKIMESINSHYKMIDTKE